MHRHLQASTILYVIPRCWKTPIVQQHRWGGSNVCMRIPRLARWFVAVETYRYTVTLNTLHNRNTAEYMVQNPIPCLTTLRATASCLCNIWLHIYVKRHDIKWKNEPWRIQECTQPLTGGQMTQPLIKCKCEVWGELGALCHGNNRAFALRTHNCHICC